MDRKSMKKAALLQSSNNLHYTVKKFLDDSEAKIREAFQNAGCSPDEVQKKVDEVRNEVEAKAFSCFWQKLKEKAKAKEAAEKRSDSFIVRRS